MATAAVQRSQIILPSPGSSSSRSTPTPSEVAIPEPLQEDEEPATVQVIRAELVRGHRPVVVSEVPLYVALKDREGRFFEDKGNCSFIRYRWHRGPVIKPCYFHPHKMSTIRDVAKTFLCYCSKECFMRGWKDIPPSLYGSKSDEELQEDVVSEWVEVATTRRYRPTAQDIDRPLRLEIIPLKDDGSDSLAGKITLVTGTVIPTPKEARTRRMIICGGNSLNAELLNKQFKVMNWNVLADLYATESVYPYCEKWALSWTWRKHLILKELVSMAADIITLQEVQKDAFEEWFRPQLEEAGYDGVYAAKKRDPVFHGGKYQSEGCATFYKVTRFRRHDKQVVDYDRMSANEVKNTLMDSQSQERSIQRLSKGNIALTVVLEDLHIKPHRSQPRGPSGGHMVCVVNTHILCDPGSTDVKLLQAHLLLQHLKQNSLCEMPLLICGDFNSTPQSAVYEYLQKGHVRHDHEDLRLDPCGLLKQMRDSFRHSMRVGTAYQSCTGHEAQYTNYTEDFKGTLDYIWYSPDALRVLAISEVDQEAQLQQETALPSSTRPSDHVSLVATFVFREYEEHQALTHSPQFHPAAPHHHHQHHHGYHMPGGHIPGNHMLGGLPGPGPEGILSSLYAQQYL